MAASGLDYSIRKKLDTQYLRDMVQLADRVRQVERLNINFINRVCYKKERKLDISYLLKLTRKQMFALILT